MVGKKKNKNREKGIIIELRKVMKNYQKHDADRFIPFCKTAVRNAVKADPDPSHKQRWPQKTGTKVYLLVEKLIPK